MNPRNVVLLTSRGEIGAITARYLAARFSDFTVVVEERESRATFLRRRLRRLGPVAVAGQIAFMLFQRLQQAYSYRRINEIRSIFDHGPPSPAPYCVTSVNDPACIALLRRLAPAAVLVMGTRIISPQVLRSVTAPFINFHAGITPKYRGVHGGYWALASSDSENFGVTVHLVDEGIDTGGILYQARGKPAPGDNFSTYPYLQLGLGLPLLAQGVDDVLAERLNPHSSSLPSRLWSHPTIWAYLSKGLRDSIW